MLNLIFLIFCAKELIEFVLQAFVSSLVMKLQLYVQQVNGALEETSQSVLSSLPRILRDTQLLQQETLALREKMVAVKQEIAKVCSFGLFNQIFCLVLHFVITLSTH